jgi:hypothetical protein
VDADALGPIVVIYTVVPNGGGLRVLHKGKWTDDPREAERELTDVILEYGKYSREQAQQSGREAAAQLARNAARQLESIQQSRAFRLAQWLDGHRRLKSFLSRCFNAASLLWRLALRACSRRYRPAAGQQAETAPGSDLEARGAGIQECRQDQATRPPANGTAREDGHQ